MAHIELKNFSSQGNSEQNSAVISPAMLRQMDQEKFRNYNNEDHETVSQSITVTAGSKDKREKRNDSCAICICDF